MPVLFLLTLRVLVLEYYYLIRGNNLEAKHLEKLSIGYVLSEELINKLIQIKTRRETAQYAATPAISRESALSALDDADEFIARIEEILTGSNL
ncbi:MAG: hypothetical protein U9P44_01200 [archaeon]|nr:hypothetical protein [archaeon]